MDVTHVYMMGLMDSPLSGGCGAEGETSAHVLCGCEASAALRYTCLPFLFGGGGGCEDVISLMSGGNLELY